MYRTCLLVAVGIVLLAGLGQSAANKRAYVASHFALELDGAKVGALSSFEGGAPFGTVLTQLAPGSVQKKMVAGVKYEDIHVECGTGLSKELYEWIADTLERKVGRRNGAIIAADFNYKERSRLNFTGAFLTEIGFPALDASSKDAAKLTLKIQPETTSQLRVIEGGTIKAEVQKKWLPANFRLSITGLDEACSRVSKVEALTFKQKVADGRETNEVEYPDLAFLCPESSADELYKWFNDFVIEGNNADEDERSGMLTYLAPDQQTELFRLTFRNLGIFKVAPDKAEAGSDSIRRVKAELYCEEMKFSYSAAATR